MCGPGAGVLYVGKAKSLRRRLGNYRVANPERVPRRIIRLLHQVTRIEWDECRDDSAARFREELLILVLQPKFNAAGKVWPLAANQSPKRLSTRGLVRDSGLPERSSEPIREQAGLATFPAGAFPLPAR